MRATPDSTTTTARSRAAQGACRHERIVDVVIVRRPSMVPNRSARFVITRRAATRARNDLDLPTIAACFLGYTRTEMRLHHNA